MVPKTWCSPQLPAAWTQLVRDFNANFAVTLAYNKHRPYRTIVSLDTVHRNLDVFHAVVDGQLFGKRRFTKLLSHQRSEFIGFCQNVDQNMHVHLAWKLPPHASTNLYNVMQEGWAKFTSHPSLLIKPIRSDYWAEYITRDEWAVALGDAQLFVSSRKLKE